MIESLDLNPERQRNGYVKPKQVHCYLCAKEFGTTSLKIHWKGCLRKLEMAQTKLKPQLRCEIPPPPDEEVFDFPTRKSSDLVFFEYNQEALRIFGAYELLRAEREGDEARRRAAEEAERRRLALALAEEERLRLLREQADSAVLKMKPLLCG